MAPLTDDDVLRRCEELAPVLAARADEAEDRRRIHDETMADIEDLLSIVVPTSLGGHGLGLDTLAHGTRIMAHGDVASAWVLSFLIMHSWLLAKFPAGRRGEFFPEGRPWALAPAPLAPTGTATPAEGGYRLSGRWEWATGSSHAEWVMVHAIEEGPELGTRFAVLPVGEVTIEDNWHTSGMRATASNAVRVDDVFVPADRTVGATKLMHRPDSVDGDGMAGLAIPPVLALMASAPAMGAAEGAVEWFRERSQERVLAFTMGDRQKDQPAAQMRYAAAFSDLCALRSRWDAAIDAVASAEPPLTDEQRVEARLAAAATVRGARAVIATIAEGSGGSAYFHDSPLQRWQRDVEVLKGHAIFDWDRTTELAGRVLLGTPLGPHDMA